MPAIDEQVRQEALGFGDCSIVVLSLFDPTHHIRTTIISGPFYDESSFHIGMAVYHDHCATEVFSKP